MDVFIKYAKKVLFSVGQFLWVLLKSFFVSFGVALEAAYFTWNKTN